MWVTFERDGMRLVGNLIRAEEDRGLAILLHGGGQTRHAWATTAHGLTAAGWSTLALDARDDNGVFSRELHTFLAQVDDRRVAA